MSEKQKQMVFDNMNLVYFVLKKINLYSKCDEYFDLGVIGLVKGVKTFDEKKNTSLSTYLFKCIKNEIISSMRKKQCETISIETVIGDDLIMLDVLKDEDVDVEEDIEKKVLLENIYKFVKTLPIDEQFIIKSFFGIEGNKKMNQEQISKCLGISQAHVSRKIRKVIDKIREAIQ